MNADKYTARMDGLLERNRFLGICLVVLVGINLVNAALLVSAQGKTQTVVVPIGGEGMQIGNGKADERYIRRMARYVTNQIGSYSAGTARHQYQELLQYFAPDKVTTVAQYFDRLVADIERYPSIASWVEWSGEQPLKFTTTMIQVLAQKQRLVNGAVTERKQVHYCIQYHIDEARFWIDNITEKEDAGTDLCFIEAAPAATPAASPQPAVPAAPAAPAPTPAPIHDQAPTPAAAAPGA